MVNFTATVATPTPSKYVGASPSLARSHDISLQAKQVVIELIMDLIGNLNNQSEPKFTDTNGTQTTVPHLRARHDVDAVNTSENGRRKLGPEGIPHAVLDLRRCAILARWGLHRYELLAVHGLRDSRVRARFESTGARYLIVHAAAICDLSHENPTQLVSYHRRLT